MEIGLVRKIDIDQEMQQAYLDYAMSVIVARALPDARDGLKPVHRRILYAMHDMGLRPDSPYKKSARIVGEVLGKYHPHGDMAVYEAMARMAQDFSMRAMLVDGQGNFGSVDGDPPAAMRYTEARLASIATHVLADIQKNTVDFAENFDGTLTEPKVLPCAFPNLLVNGTTGIAVGMATSIPPHNLNEVIDALVYLLENWEKLEDISVEDLMRYVKGPDFPTGGVIIQDAEVDNLAGAYATGRGAITVQARAHLEEMTRGRNRIIVTELPYMTNKSSLIERIASLAREERIEGIADLRDESDRQGMRIVIELNKAADPDAVLRDLYKSTQMRSTFSIILLALVEGEPRMLGLKQALRVYVEHRLTVIRRRSEYDLERARQRAHILEGLRIALKNLDEVIAMIRRSPDADSARLRLIKRFKLTESQAQAILDMPLRRLASLERKKIEDEYREVVAQIKELETLLRSQRKMRQVASGELLAIKQVYGEPRRTRIVQLGKGETRATKLTTTDLVPEHAVWVMVSPTGLVSRTADEKLPRLSGGEAATNLVLANSRDTVYLAATNGETAAIPVHTLPEMAKPSEGVPFQRVSALTDRHDLAAVFTLPGKDDRAGDWFLVTFTRQGMVKKSLLSDLPGPSAQTFTLVRVNQGDRLGWVHMTDGEADVLLVSASGMAIRFNEEEIRPMGLVAGGVIGIKLPNKEELVGAEVIPARGEVFLAASDATAKRVTVDQFPRQGRNGQGVIAWKLPGGVRVAGFAIGKAASRAVLCLMIAAPKSVRFDEAPQQGRSARGKRLFELKSKDEVTSLVVPREAARPPNVKASGDGEPAPKAVRGRSSVPVKASTEKKPARKISGSKSTTLAITSSATKPAAKTPVRRGSRSTKTPGSAKPAPQPSRRKPSKPAKTEE
ncbi:MAG TPA: DNA gyrase subunit A [Anaerolineales bacterium]|nr:DNA gyrase subunit A [Anaerolineales bacterium]